MLEALIELEERGIPVRVVIDTDYEDESAIARLRRNGISVVTDDRSALMHNKFLVIDGRYTWVGSMNFTTNGAHCNNNNLVRLDSAQLAQNYITELNEMYDDREFGPRSPENTPNEQVTIGGVLVENYFAPEKELAPIIGDLVNTAQSEILFMAFSFTVDLIGEPMLERAEAGVTVRGVFETTGSETQFSYYGDMQDAGLANMQVRQDGNPRVMHHKVIIIDRQTVVLGSFNFSASANDNNDENIVIVHDPTFTSFFVEEFNTVWSEARQE
jgi:phosphatidylserine/phosphatidylglycerophosphate/cardiolipin synthase-like enzyme